MRRISIYLVALCMSFACGASSGRAQAPASSGKFEMGASYDWTRANAPAGQCVCFSLNGGSGIIAARLPHKFSVLAEIGGNHANNLSGGSQAVTTYTYLAGARYTVPAGRTAGLYGEVLLGATHEASNYVYVANSNAFTVGAGGGVRVAVGRMLGLNLFQADWLHSDLPNGSNNRQNDVRIATGFYVRLGTR